MRILIANWKANPAILEEAQELFRAEIIEAAKYKNVQTVICPPLVFIEELAKQLQTTNPEKASGVKPRGGHATLRGPRGFTGYEPRKGQWPSGLYWLQTSLCAQDVFWEESEISEPRKLGIKYVLVGHSDRRYKIGESDAVINKKLKAALLADVLPILLVGERNRGDDRRQVLEKQLSADLEGLDSAQVSKVLIAYEPVWAISTTPGAEADTPENTLEAMKIISDFLSKNCKLETSNFLYGGSITEKNVADFLSRPKISGAVIGGASLRKDEFANILKIVSGIE